MMKTCLVIHFGKLYACKVLRKLGMNSEPQVTAVQRGMLLMGCKRFFSLPEGFWPFQSGFGVNSYNRLVMP